MSLTPFERAIHAGLRAVQSVHGAEVTYTTVGGTSLTVSRAMQGRTEFTGIDQDTGAETTVESVDWLIDIEALLTGPPAVGDSIARTIGSTTHTYSVESPVQGVHHYDINESGRRMYRIHTREDGTSKTNLLNVFDLAGNEVRHDGT